MTFSFLCPTSQTQLSLVCILNSFFNGGTCGVREICWKQKRVLQSAKHVFVLHTLTIEMPLLYFLYWIHRNQAAFLQRETSLRGKLPHHPWFLLGLTSSTPASAARTECGFLNQTTAVSQLLRIHVRCMFHIFFLIRWLLNICAYNSRTSCVMHGIDHNLYL